MSQPISSSVTLPLESTLRDIYPLITSLRPNWSPSNLRLYQLIGGINNTAFGIYSESDRSDTLVIKIYGFKTEEFIDRYHEKTILSTLVNHGLAQPVLLQFTNGIIYKFIPGSVCTENYIRNIRIAPLIARHLAKLHSIPLENQYHEPCLMPLIKKFVKLIITNHKHYPEDFVSLCSDIDCIEKDLLPSMFPNPRYGIDLVLCHNDLACTNILYNASSQTISFIDFEYSAINYALFDIANHFVEYVGVDQMNFDRCPTRNEQYHWLKIYFQARKLSFDDPEKTYRQIEQFSALAHLCYGLWAFAQVAFATVEHEYLSYGQRRLNRYKEMRSMLFNR
ncbi:unnamed protein product [Adineta ricciae]|uniref:ethanolamine kinase n=1 Tax=Adineta ricciae TaxID=249248 RepID=A0A814XW32_ADIRI|nr:unnamed protein product [Adineta ricciae]CAF1221071.1 unnamed protein product [Adineta ricciae]